MKKMIYRGVEVDNIYYVDVADFVALYAISSYQ